MINLLFSKNFKNSAWSFIDIFLYPLLFILTTPFFIDKLGEKPFGVWMLVNSIMISMQVFNLGLGIATFKNVAAHLGHKSYAGVRETVNTNLSLSALIHLVCIVAGLFIAIGIRYFSFFNIETDFMDLAAGGAFMGGLIVGLKFYEQVIGYTFKAYERFDMAAWVNTGSRLLILGVNCILAYLGYGLIPLFIVTILLSAAGIAVGLILIKTQIQGYVPAFHLNKASIRHELHFAIWPWFQSLAIILTFQCDRFFVVTFLGLATLTYYGLVATIFNHIHMGFNAIVPWLAPKITKLKTQGKDVGELYLTARNLCLAVALTALLAFNLLHAPVLSWILGEDKYNHSREYIKFFTLFELFFVYAIVPNYFLNASGHEKLYFRIVIGYCIAILTGMVSGYYVSHNVEGLLSGLIISTGISMLVQDIIINNHIVGDKGIKSSLILFTPPCAIALCVLTDNVLIKTLLVLVSLSAIYLVFKRYNKINLHLIKHD